jgi:hypothetical protein
VATVYIIYGNGHFAVLLYTSGIIYSIVIYVSFFSGLESLAEDMVVNGVPSSGRLNKLKMVAMPLFAGIGMICVAGILVLFIVTLFQ